MQRFKLFKSFVTNTKSLLAATSLICMAMTQPASSDVYVGVDGGFASADMKAEQTASRLATLSGSTVTYVYDEAAGHLRGYLGVPVNETISIEGGYFKTGSLDATYTIGGASATESYYANGFEVSAVLRGEDIKKGGFYARGGIHFSELHGDASITIGGTTYDIASVSTSGSGMLLGAGVELEKSADGAGIRFGVDLYGSLGGADDADFTLFYIGYAF